MAGGSKLEPDLNWPRETAAPVLTAAQMVPEPSRPASQANPSNHVLFSPPLPETPQRPQHERGIESQCCFASVPVRETSIVGASALDATELLYVRHPLQGAVRSALPAVERCVAVLCHICEHKGGNLTEIPQSPVT